MRRLLPQFMRHAGGVGVLLLGCWATASAQVAPDSGRVVVAVYSSRSPLAEATVRSGTAAAVTDPRGRARLVLPAGEQTLAVSKIGFKPDTLIVAVRPGEEVETTVNLERAAVQLEALTVTSTRTEQQQGETPIRVEVVSPEEMGEKSQLAPGTIANLLDQIAGVRIQTTSPALGGANVRIQGLRGRYTQVLSDGLPLYGGQTGSVGLLQIPPLDLDRVEVIRGVTSALYGAQALGGVINLLSRGPEPSQEALLNQTSRDGTDLVGWSAGRLTGRWSYTLLASGHRQDREDMDRDGWADIAGYRRLVVRPRLFWNDSAGSSFLITGGGTVEDREGGTLEGATAPDGAAFPEALDTRRFDVGAIGRVALGSGRVLNIRASAMQERHRHTFGSVLERDRYRTGFAEVALTATQEERATWVVGGAFQVDGYNAADVPRFNFTYTVPGVFAQYDRSLASWLRASASARLDVHSSAGTWLSPRVSLLLHRPGDAWAAHVSAGTGFSAPTPLVEETEVIGLSRLLPLGSLLAERARGLSADVSRTVGHWAFNASLFGTVVDHALQVRAAPSSPGAVELINAPGPTRAFGGDALLHWEAEPLAVTVFYGYLHATEPAPETGDRREVPLNPRHRFGADVVLGDEEEGRIGVELTYTGRQSLDEGSSSALSRPYVEIGILAQKRLGRAQIFLNCENIFDVRLSGYTNPLLSTPGLGGRWTIDAWAPLDGRVINLGLRTPW